MGGEIIFTDRRILFEFLGFVEFPPSLFISICLFEKRDNEFGSFVFFLKEKQKLLKIEKIQHDSILRYF